MRRPDLRLGIDVGGTNTDAVVLDRDDSVLAKAKTPTTRRRHGGIRAALDAVLARARGRPRRGSPTSCSGRPTPPTRCSSGARLQRVAVLRLGAPATRSVPPLLAWPDDLRDAVSAGEAIVGGGLEFDGREIVAVRRATRAARFLERCAGQAEAVAMTRRVLAGLGRARAGRARPRRARCWATTSPVSLSHEIGSLGLIERENATVLNAALRRCRDGGRRGARAGARRRTASTPTVFFAQNDGTLMALDYAIRYPVLTIGSGPANSHARRRLPHAAARTRWWPTSAARRPTSACSSTASRASRRAAVEIGGIRTNFRMPDLRRDRARRRHASSRTRAGAARRARTASATELPRAGAGVRRRRRRR